MTESDTYRQARLEASRIGQRLIVAAVERMPAELETEIADYMTAVAELRRVIDEEGS